MMDMEQEASTQGDSGSSLRQRRHQGLIVATCFLYIYIHVVCNYCVASVPLCGRNHARMSHL